MSAEDQTIDVTALPKFDMSSYESKTTAKDVKSLALHYGIPLDLHPVALTEGWTMDKLPNDMIACAVRIELIDYVLAILSEPNIVPSVNYPAFFIRLVNKGTGFLLKNRRVILDAMAWRHHDSDINDLVLEDGFSMQDVEALTERVIDLRSGQDILEKTDHQRMVEMEDPKIVATRERKARAAAKKRERKKQGGDGGERSRPKTKRRKTLAESRENCSPPASPRDSAYRSMHNYSDDHRDEETDDINLGSSGEQFGRALTLVNTEVIQPSPACQHTNWGPTADRLVTPLTIVTQGVNAAEGKSSREGALYVPGWSIHRRCRVDNPMWCRELMVHLAPPTAQKESNALNNATTLERAWFSLARGSISQTNILERLDLTHNTYLYTSLSDRHKALKNGHEGCAGKLEGLENRNRELSQANMDQVLQIKELEAALAHKDSAFIYAERINAEHA
nr:hypothetical protein [Tanacetum cinerariifolium]